MAHPPAVVCSKAQKRKRGGERWRPPPTGALFVTGVVGCVRDGGADEVEPRRNVGAQAGERADENDGDERSDQRVLDGGNAAAIFSEADQMGQRVEHLSSSPILGQK